MEFYNTNVDYKGTHVHKLTQIPKSFDQVIYVLEVNNHRVKDGDNNYHLWDIFKLQAFTFNASEGSNNQNNIARHFAHLSSPTK